MAEYHCRVYGEGGVEAQSTHLRIESDHIRLTDSAYANNPLPFDQLDLEVVGSGPYCVQIKAQSQELTIVLPDVAILSQLGALPMNSRLGKQARLLKDSLVKKHRSHRKQWTIVVAALVAIPVLAFIFLNAVINQSIAQIDPSYEARLGTWIAESQERKSSADKNEAQEKRVRAIGEKLVAHLQKPPYKFFFFVAQDPEINACAYPGGVVVVNSGLVEAGDDDELAGVIGHEIGHVLHRDTLRATMHNLSLGLSFSAFLHLIGLGGDGADLHGKHLAELMEELESLSYSRGQEAAADREGVLMAMRAGYSGEGLVNFFDKESKKKGAAGAVTEQLTGLFSTHPLDKERMAAIRAEVAKYKNESKAK
ncbi:MAG: M48 family metalloprotease [Cyanobacteria bacterium SZAS TMP-1]|nr:M48 family metalloprotease [Cyanobacteria bacterium SZAS TMP-1]